MTTPDRRWFAFSLRTIFVGVACLAGYLAWQANIVHGRKTILAEMMHRGATVEKWANLKLVPGETAVDVPMIRRWMGDEAILGFLMNEVVSESERAAIRKVFPEAGVAGIDPDVRE